MGRCPHPFTPLSIRQDTSDMYITAFEQRAGVATACHTRLLHSPPQLGITIH